VLRLKKIKNWRKNLYPLYRKIITPLLILFIIFNLPLAGIASRLYTDIPPGHWAENAADVMGQKEIMKGISTNEFGGKLKLKRYDVAEIINGLLGNRSVPTSIILLEDVRSGHPNFRVIMKVLSINLMEIQGNKFNGEKKVSRYDFGKFMVNTLNYSQADPISIRQVPIPVTNVADDKKAIVDKVLNYWQLTEGYNDWGQDISRFEALEMVARAAMILDPDIISSIGPVARPGTEPNVTPTPYQTPIPVRTPYTTPVPVQTPRATPEPVYTPEPTPVPVRTPVESTPTPEPVYTPSTPTPSPEITVEPTPGPVRTPVISIPTPEPVYTPAISSPSPEVSIEPTPVPTTEATPEPVHTSTPVGSNFSPVLRSQVILKGGYNFLYSESLPSNQVFINETVRNYDDILGATFGADFSYWFKDFDIEFIKDMGTIVNISSQGYYIFPIPTQLAPKYDTEISEAFRGNLGILYKFYKSQDFEIAGGFDTYYRSTARASTVPAASNNSYWRTSKNYLGVGAKALAGWKITDKITVEGDFALHYVAQTFNEKITYTTGSQIPAGTVFDRFDTEFGLNARMDLLQIGNSWLFVNVNLDSRILLGDGNQTIVGGGLGAGINF
jgi:hypothetical protein